MYCTHNNTREPTPEPTPDTIPSKPQDGDGEDTQSQGGDLKVEEPGSAVDTDETVVDGSENMPQEETDNKLEDIELESSGSQSNDTEVEAVVNDEAPNNDGDTQEDGKEINEELDDVGDIVASDTQEAAVESIGTLICFILFVFSRPSNPFFHANSLLSTFCLSLISSNDGWRLQRYSVEPK